MLKIICMYNPQGKLIKIKKINRIRLWILKRKRKINMIEQTKEHSVILLTVWRFSNSV